LNPVVDPLVTHQDFFPMWSIILLFGGVLAMADPNQDTSHAGTLRVYVGTYTGGPSRGIYLLELDTNSGALGRPRLVGETENPSFLALHPTGKYLYAVNEVDQGGVSAFAIDANSGKLTFLNRQSSQGSGPCHLVVDRAGKNVLVATYGSGTLAVLPIEADGHLRPSSSSVQHKGSSANPERQEGPHAHSINLDAANHFAVAADLGLDKVLVYRFDPSQGTLTPNDPPFTSVAPGAGPRHFAFHPDGRHAYVINEMQSTVTAFDYDPERGTLAELQTITTLPRDYADKNFTAEGQVHPSGKFLYGSNRGHDSIAIFTIDARTGRLEPVGHQSTYGKTPRHFGIDPSGRFLLAANQDSNTLVVFRIDPQSGRLQPTGHSTEVPKPVCVKFVAVGR
jgi:6-phosphogluconolactonase